MQVMVSGRAAQVLNPFLRSTWDVVSGAARKQKLGVSELGLKDDHMLKIIRVV